MRILILGGTGLISSAIVTQLVHRGDGVVAFHRRPARSLGSLTHVPGDRSSASDLRGVLDHGPFDAVVDMVCFHPDQARAAADIFHGRTAQYVLCSTVDVYRKDAGGYPLSEDAERGARPSFGYASDKLACERVLEAAAADGAFELTIIRPAATYANSAVAPVGSYQLYIGRLRAGLPIVLHGDGSSIWTTAHRDDVAEAFVGALGNERSHGRSYHVTGSELLTWNSYWRTVAHAAGVDSPEFVHIPTDTLARLAPAAAHWCVENFQYNNIFDNSAAERDLGYRYRTTWAAGAAQFDFAFSRAVPHDVEEEFDRMMKKWVSMSDPMVRS